MNRRNRKRKPQQPPKQQNPTLCKHFNNGHCDKLYEESDKSKACRLMVRYTFDKCEPCPEFEENDKKQCPTCKSWFESKHRLKKYCSPICKVKK